MARRVPLRRFLKLVFFRPLPIGLVLAMVSGCDYSSPTEDATPQGTLQGGFNPPLPRAQGVAGTSAESAAASVPLTGSVPSISSEERVEERAAILENVIKQIQAAAITPGGDNFRNATKNLNQYFAGQKPSDYLVDAKARAFLEPIITKRRVDELETPSFELPDARHLEDCMMYQGIAKRVAGVGRPLTRVRRVFDWMVDQVQLVPAGSLGSQGMQHAIARPFDVLLRGMATESEGMWSERGWLFLSLCRQLGLDAAMIRYTPEKVKEPVVWCCGVLIDGKVYLFDPRVGMAVPDAKGDGVATLDEAMTNPLILDRMDIPGQSAYGTTRDALAGSPTKIGVMMDSGMRYFSPRMKLLQQNLAGKNQTILFRDPAEQVEQWKKALGGHCGEVKLWELPMTVETLLFTNPQFVESTLRALILFRPDFPLLYARMKQLRGETADAIHDYIGFRFAEKALMRDKKTPIPKEVQDALDVYATFYLGTAHLEINDLKQAEFFFEKTLAMLPEPGRGQPYYNMYRWGAQANLGRIKQAKGELDMATAYFGASDPTPQNHGNLFHARDIVWKNPTGPVAPTLAPPPPSVAGGTQAAVR